MLRYHDEEWGVPCHDDRALFELLTLEGAQAGLSWDTILRKREGYRSAFAGFDADKIGAFGDADLARLLADPGIVRNLMKISAAVANAHALLTVREVFGSFDAYIWRFAPAGRDGNGLDRMSDIPAKTPESEAMSRDLRGRGFSFVGPTICYAFMQAAGLVNDHLAACFRSREL